MSRWGVAALAVAAATVVAIGMVALRLSDGSLGDAQGGSSGSAASASTSPQPWRSSGDDPSRQRDPEAVQRRSGTGHPTLHTQLRRLKRSLDRSNRKTGSEFYVTVSLREPLPLRTATRPRRTPLPREMPASTVYTLYAETGGTPHRVSTKNLEGDRTRRVSGVPRRRLVVLGMSMQVRDYRAVRRDLRSLPIGERDVGLEADDAKYLPDARFGNRTLRSWARFYRRS